MIGSFSVLRRAAVALAAGVALGLTFAAGAVQAQSSVKVELGGAGPASRALSLPRGKSAIIDLPVDARDVLVSNPAVADAVLRTPRRIYVLGVGAGSTDAVFFDASGRQILSLDIRVDQDTGALVDTIRRLAPASDVRVEAVGDSIALTGSVASLAESDRVQRVAERFVAKPEMVLNMLSIRGGDQVMLKVRVVEMQRNLIKQLGVNVNALINTLGDGQFSIVKPVTYAINNTLGGGITGGYHVVDGDKNISASLQAFERVGVVRTLAEPNLTAISGESAKFLAGGEFPVPTGLDQNGNIVVTFKPFGIALGFTPVVLSEGRISLKLSTEVSELTSEGSLTFGGSLVIPGLSVRRAETVVEMPSGGSMMIAGLLQEKTKQNIDSIPGLTTLPVLGALFRSRDYVSGETELVVIVQPYLVRAGDRMQTPADGLQIANDAETILMGRMNKAYGRGGAPSAPGAPYQGPIGYVIE
jgi:pilus assembly protein CpaC